jgi:hypothetical protein
VRDERDVVGYDHPPKPSGDTSWMSAAACKDIPTNIFFPTRGDIHSLRAAQAICDVCPVREPCRDYGIRNKLLGVWGGVSGRQQRRARRAVA